MRAGAALEAPLRLVGVDRSCVLGFVTVWCCILLAASDALGYSHIVTLGPGQTSSTGQQQLRRPMLLLLLLL
jgi:hypothetical protein